MKIKLIFVLFATLLNNSQQQCFSWIDSSAPKSKVRLYTGQQEFSFAFLQALNQLTPTKNLIFSPYSIYQAVLLVFFFSEGETQNYLKKILRLNATQTQNDLFYAYKLDKILTTFNNKNSSSELFNANRMFISDQVNLQHCITTIFEDEFAAAPFQSDPESARTIINNWVKTNTRNNIKEVLPPEGINSNTPLVLVSAAYFKGKWKNQFNLTETRLELFFVDTIKRLTVTMMQREGTFNHGVSKSLEAHILELPYEGDQLSMYVFLPPFTKEGAIDNILKKLGMDEFQSVIEQLSPKTVLVSFPKFFLEQTIQLGPILERIGVGFKNDVDFSKLSNKNDVSVHKAKILVNEEGSTVESSAPIIKTRLNEDENEKPVIFKCNHPFVFVIFNKITKTVLFTGVVRRPA